MKILHNSIKDSKDEWLAKTLQSINHRNPVIDRIANDNSILSVTFTNQAGIPIYTNTATNNATEYGRKTHKLSIMVRESVRELNVFDEVVALRISTKKFNIVLVPHEEFNILVVQQPRGNLAKDLPFKNQKK